MLAKRHKAGEGGRACWAFIAGHRRRRRSAVAVLVRCCGCGLLSLSSPTAATAVSGTVSCRCSRRRTVRVHVRALVATQIGELRVGLVAGLADERLHARVNVHMLLEARGRAELLAALRTRIHAARHQLQVVLRLHEVTVRWLAHEQAALVQSAH